MTLTTTWCVVAVQDDGQRHVILNHKKHIRAVVCPAFQPKCDPIVVYVHGSIVGQVMEVSRAR